jgi:thiol-disulfide isomerase/thioredoxin
VNGGRRVTLPPVPDRKSGGRKMLFEAIAVIAGVISLINLVLVLGVIKRLRETPAGNSQAHGTEEFSPIAFPGRTVPPFVVRTTTGEQITEASLSGNTLVGFFSPGCATCKVRIPDFLILARRLERESGRAIAVVTSADNGGAEIVAKLESAAQVCVGEDGEGLQVALEVGGFPAFALFEDDVMVQSGTGMPLLSDPVAA